MTRTESCQTLSFRVDGVVVSDLCSVLSTRSSKPDRGRQYCLRIKTVHQMEARLLAGKGRNLHREGSWGPPGAQKLLSVAWVVAARSLFYCPDPLICLSHVLCFSGTTVRGFYGALCRLDTRRLLRRRWP